MKDMESHDNMISTKFLTHYNILQSIKNKCEMLAIHENVEILY